MEKLKRSDMLISSKESNKKIWNEKVTPLGGVWNSAWIIHEIASYSEEDSIDIIEVEKTPQVEEIIDMKKKKVEMVKSLPEQVLSRPAYFRLYGNDIEITNREALLSSLDTNTDLFRISEQVVPKRSIEDSSETIEDSSETLEDVEKVKGDNPNYTFASIKKAISKFFRKEK